VAKKKRQREQATPPAARPTVAAEPRSAPPPVRAHPEWRWRTFPVFFAFVIGLLAASFINGRPSNNVAALVQLAALLGFGYCLAHLFVMNVVVAGRIKHRQQAAERGDQLDEDFEEDLVYPGEPPPAP
jgi:lipopolysaccharide export LptBFGC system permease protein LptF